MCHEYQIFYPAIVVLCALFVFIFPFSSDFCLFASSFPPKKLNSRLLTNFCCSRRLQSTFTHDPQQWQHDDLRWHRTEMKIILCVYVFILRERRSLCHLRSGIPCQPSLKFYVLEAKTRKKTVMLSFRANSIQKWHRRRRLCRPCAAAKHKLWMLGMKTGGKSEIPWIIYFPFYQNFKHSSLTSASTRAH